MGLALVTGGVGGLAEAGVAEAGEAGLSLAGRAGASVLSRLTPETATAVSRAAGTVGKLATAGFSVQQIGNVAATAPRVADAIHAGDYDTALELGTQALLGTVPAAECAGQLICDQFSRSTD